MIAIIDYKAGNIASLVAALKRLQQECIVTNNPVIIQAADKVIFPGQGRAAPAIRELQRIGLDKIIPTLTQPFLGICLGMQLLLDFSEEDNTTCLGIIPGQVKKFVTNLPVPQVGWNSGYYFVHSYYVTTQPRYIIAKTQYGEQWFCSMIAKDNFYGVQFHPEKSGTAGLQLLQQFCKTGKIQPTQLIPAIDILAGNCVRLQQGDYAVTTQYSTDPLKVAQQFEADGAVRLHVVDLDGAKSGKPVNQNLILDIVQKTNLRVEVGGGIRSLETACYYLNHGVDRIILGTAAITQPTLIKTLIQQYGPERIVVGLDLKANDVAVNGWTMRTGITLEDSLEQLKRCGVQTIIATDISKDGMLAGPNLTLTKTIQHAGFNVIVSGGVSSSSDIESVQKLQCAGMIIGKALYEGKVSIKPTGFTKRIIACLDIANSRVVKGTRFANLKDAGDAVELAQRYADQGADEIVFLDIMATVENRNTLYHLVQQVAATLSIPFTVGGGIKTVSDIRTLLLAGADKVSIGSAAITNPALVFEASQQFGTQCIVISLDPKWNGKYWELYIKGGHKATGVNAVDFAKQMEQLGAGELLVNSLDRDGTKQGYDLALLQAISSTVTIPVIASSGVGTAQHILEAFKQTKVSATLVAGVLHNGQLTVRTIKQYVSDYSIPIRL